MDLETSQRGYLFAGGTKYVPLGEIVRRMVQVKARYHETSDVGERTLLRGEYKYFTGKPCDLRAAQTTDIVVYLECSAFFGFWDVGQVDRMLEVLHQRSMSLWLDTSSSTSSSALPGADEIDTEELRRLLLCLPALRKEGCPLYRHLTTLLSSMLTHSSQALAEDAVLSPEEACELFLASTAQTPRSFLLALLPVVAPGVCAGVFSLSILVELFDTLGSLLLSASSSVSSIPAALSSSHVLEAEVAGEEEEEVRRRCLPLFTQLRNHLFASRDQLDPLEMAITYHAMVRWQEEMLAEKKKMESVVDVFSSSSSLRHSTNHPTTKKLRRGEKHTEKNVSIVEGDDVFLTHQAFLHSFVKVGSAHTMCPRAAAIFFSAFSMAVTKRKIPPSASSSPLSSPSPPSLHTPFSTSSSFPKAMKEKEEDHHHHQYREGKGQPKEKRSIHDAPPRGRSLATGEVEGDECYSLVSFIPQMAELLGPRMIYLAVEFTPAELLPILEVWMEAVVHYFVMEVRQHAFLPSSSSISLGKPQQQYTTTITTTTSLTYRLLRCSPPSSLLHVVKELLEQLRVLLTESTSFLSSSALLSLFSFFHRAIETMSNAVDHLFSASRFPIEEREEQEKKRGAEEHLHHHPPLSAPPPSSRMIHTPYPFCTTDGAMNTSSSSLCKACPTHAMTAVEVATMWVSQTIPTLPFVWKSMSEKVPAMCQRSSASPFSKVEELQYLLSLPSCLLQESSKGVVRQALRTRFRSTISCPSPSPISPPGDVALSQ